MQVSHSDTEQQATEIVIQFTGQEKKEQQSEREKNHASIHSPGDDEFEENNLSDEIHEGRVRKNSSQKKGRKKLQDITSNEDSPGTTMKGEAKMAAQLKDEMTLHKDAYEIVYKYYPPNPILPKTFQVYDDSPRSGAEFAFLKLIKFKGKDHGKSKLEVQQEVNHIEFPEAISLKSIFSTMSEGTDDNSRATPFGEIVFLRSVLDFTSKNIQPGAKKDEVLEENLLDVRRILKNSLGVNGAHQQQQVPKKGLLNLQGVEQFYKKKDQFDKTLIFESRFESGNLAAALKVNDSEYHLLLQNDVNTSGHTQWFFFRVSNSKRFNTVRFNILNLSKPDSLFNEGMKVLIYSDKLSEDKDIGWHRGCTNISYYQNGIRKDSNKRYKSYYTLTFSYEFQYDDDYVYFAYCYPYTYTDMLDDLSRICNDPNKSQMCTRKTLCLSLAGNKIEMLTITSRNNLENLNKRKGVFISSRVHPGESVGSWMLKGAIDFLTDENNEEAEILRQNFVFKIIPMLNPDGVVNGNYRCSLAGCDLNRRWKAPSKLLHPCIYYTKQALQQFAKERELVVFCDFHGHSRRKNIFMYGCHVPAQPEDTRLYPFLLSKICPFFDYKLSRFGNQKSKEATARVAMFNDIKIPTIYTMESSFCGNDQGPFAGYHFSTDNLMQTGRDFCRTLFLYCSIPIPKEVTQNLLDQIMGLLGHYKNENTQKDLLQQDRDIDLMQSFGDKMKQYDETGTEVSTKQIKKALLQVLRQMQDLYIEGESNSSAGSDQAPSEDNLEPEEITMVVPSALEDEALLTGKKPKNKKKDQPQPNGQDLATSVSPIRKKSGADNVSNSQQKRSAALTKGNKKMSTLLKLPNQKDKGGASDINSSKVNLKDTLKNTIEGENLDKKMDDDGEGTLEKKTEETLPLDDDAVMATGTQKKKRKRNVESRDAWTQTDRSDYMLIKYRQKQKQAMQLAKSQKFTKEEQIFYEQQLSLQAQQQLMNRTQEVSSISSSVNTGLQKMIKEYPASFKDSNHSQTLRMGIASSTFAGMHSREKDTTTTSQSTGGAATGTNQQQISRNLISSQSNSKGRGGQQQHHQQQQQQQPQQQYSNPLVKTQPMEVLKQDINQLQFVHFPYQQFSNTQDMSKSEKIDSNQYRLNTLAAGNKKTSHQQNPLQQQQYQLNQQSNQYYNQNTLPSIQTPNQMLQKRKTQPVPNGGAIGSLTITKKPNEHPLIYFNNNRMIETHSELSSQHSTQRLNPQNNLVKQAYGYQQQQQQQPSYILLDHSMNKQPKSLPPKPYQHQQQQQQQLIMKSIQDSQEFYALGKESLQPSGGIISGDNETLGNVRVMENAYIQSKLQQQEPGSSSNNHETLQEDSKHEYASFSHYQQQNQQQQQAQNHRGKSSISKGNFFQTHQMLDDTLNASQSQSTSKKGKRKSSELVSVGGSNSGGVSGAVGTLQGQTIKKMIENSWKAVQQQHMSQSFYQGQPIPQYTQYGQYAMSSAKQSAIPGQRARKLKEVAKPQQQQQQQQQTNQFINVQGLIPQNIAGANSSGSKATSGNTGPGNGVKISIVNVHNQFNIHNNIIINNAAGILNQQQQQSKTANTSMNAGTVGGGGPINKSYQKSKKK